MKLIKANDPNLQIPLYLLNKHLPSYHADETHEYITKERI